MTKQRLKKTHQQIWNMLKCWRHSGVVLHPTNSWLAKLLSILRSVLDEAFEVPHEFLDELGCCTVHEEADGEQKNSANNHESVYII
jgi:hypothetical protein